MADLNPSLAREWHLTKNDPLTPLQVKPGSNKKAWWLCPTCGHEWEAVISSRSRGVGCPECGKAKGAQARSTPQLGKSLADLDPSLAREWHLTKNDPLTPLQVKPGSSKKAWWLCPTCGHEWEAVISSRSSGVGCPECGKAKGAQARSTPQLGESLTDLNPSLAAEWHPTKNVGLTPSDVLPKSNRSVWWQCSECAYEWKTTVASRSAGTGCRRCVTYAGNNVISEVFDAVGLSFESEANLPGLVDKAPLWIDILLPNERVMVEYDGVQHFRPTRRGRMSDAEMSAAFEDTQRKDRIKDDYAARHGFVLVRLTMVDVTQYPDTDPNRYTVVPNLQPATVAKALSAALEPTHSDLASRLLQLSEQMMV